MNDLPCPLLALKSALHSCLISCSVRSRGGGSQHSSTDNPLGVRGAKEFQARRTLGSSQSLDVELWQELQGRQSRIHLTLSGDDCR